MNELALAELAVAAPLRHQLIVTALFDDATAIEYQDSVCTLHGG